MQATRKLLQSSGGGSFLPGTPKLLLPPVSFFEHASASLQGAWSHVVDQSARDKYEKAVEHNVIKDVVLQNATGGAAITFSLFHNLYQNPLFEKYDFNAEEFVTAVGPALENFHDALALLRNELPEHARQEKEKLDRKLQQSDEELLTSVHSHDKLTETLLGVNIWREEAEKETGSEAGKLSRMTTDACLDAFYYTSKLDALSRVTLDGAHGGLDSYVPGSCKVNEVALLSARAMVIEPKKDTIDVEHPEFEASEESFSKDGNVAAQIDVLYEITHTYRTHDPATAEAYSVMVDGNKELNDKVSEEEKDASEALSSESSSVTGDTLSYTNLAVAVFEGWLHHEDNTEGLRWKIALLREAFEFPQNQPTVVRNPAP